jgi:hypothetical protein
MLTVWGWSSQSPTDAARVAEERLAQALERVAREGGLPPGHGYYPRMPLREPVLEEVEAAAGAVLGVVTRNRMGCEVLCTDLLFIADVDVPGLEDTTARGGRPGDGSGAAGDGGSLPRRRPRTGVGGFLRRLLWGDPAPTPMTPGEVADDEAADPAPASPRPGGTSVAECLACEPLWEFARRHPELGVRVYRTARRAPRHRHGSGGIPRLGPGARAAHRAGVGPALRRPVRHSRQLPGAVDAQALPGRRSCAAGAVAVRRRRCTRPVPGVAPQRG